MDIPDKIKKLQEQHSEEIAELLKSIQGPCERLLQLSKETGNPVLVVDCPEFIIAIQPKEDAIGSN